MNLLNQGAHAATDWMLIKLRAVRGNRLEVILHDDGQLHVRPFTSATKPARLGQSLGIYRNGIRYGDLLADLEAARLELQASPRLIRESGYWPSRVAA